MLGGAALDDKVRRLHETIAVNFEGYFLIRKIIHDARDVETLLEVVAGAMSQWGPLDGLSKSQMLAALRIDRAVGCVTEANNGGE